MHNILNKLSEGDMRTIGDSENIVQEVLGNDNLFEVLISGIFSEDKGLRMRAADAVEKVTIQRPELLAGYSSKLIEISKTEEQQEVQWHLAQIFPRMDLTDKEKALVLDVMDNYFTRSDSSIVRVMSLQCIYDLLMKDAGKKRKLVEFLKKAENDEAPSVKARAKGLLKNITK